MKALVCLALLATPGVLRAQSDQRPEILILGTFHMANPGHDIHSTRVDDMLSPKRQQDIAELMDVLKKFNPTKIAIEDNVTSTAAPRQYASYLAGTFTLNGNEIDQIGYRLAKELGHKTVYPVDVDGDFPYTRVVNYAKANGINERFDSINARTAARVKAQDEFLASHTVLETLEYMNSDSMVATDVAEYFDFVPFGEPWEYAGSDLLAAWYQRNIRIYRNIRALASAAGERVLVIYGSGHLGWLRQDVMNDAGVRLVKLSDLSGSNYRSRRI